MLSQENDLSPLLSVFLNLYNTQLARKKIQVPQHSRRVLEELFNKAFRQTVMVSQLTPMLNTETALLTSFITEIDSLRKDKQAIILVSRNEVHFTGHKKSPYSIAVVQPKIPEKEHYVEKTTQYGKILSLKAEAKQYLLTELAAIMGELKKIDIDFVCFPELFFLDEKEFRDGFVKLAVEKNCFVVAGSVHDEKQESNISKIFLPSGKIIEQNKIFRAENEGIKERPIELLEIMDFEESSFCVLICIDSEREAIREILKERVDKGDCPVLIFNPSDTQHPDRAINILTNNLMILLSAAIVFCNTKHTGGSTILVPLVKLKNNKFKLFQIDPLDETRIEKGEVDLALLLANRKNKKTEVVSMIR